MSLIETAPPGLGSPQDDYDSQADHMGRSAQFLCKVNRLSRRKVFDNRSLDFYIVADLEGNRARAILVSSNHFLSYCLSLRLLERTFRAWKCEIKFTGDEHVYLVGL